MISVLVICDDFSMYDEQLTIYDWNQGVGVYTIYTYYENGIGVTYLAGVFYGVGYLSIVTFAMTGIDINGRVIVGYAIIRVGLGN